MGRSISSEPHPATAGAAETRRRKTKRTAGVTSGAKHLCPVQPLGLLAVEKRQCSHDQASTLDGPDPLDPASNTIEGKVTLVGRHTSLEEKASRGGKARRHLLTAAPRLVSTDRQSRRVG